MSEKGGDTVEVGQNSKITWEYLQELGFRDGQRLPDKEQAFHNEGLYNLDGQKVGWGDLSRGQVDFLIKELPEPILLLGEEASHWKFVSYMDFNNTPSGDTSVGVVNRKAESDPRLTYILRNLHAIILPNSTKSKYPSGLYRVDSILFTFSGQDPEVFKGVRRLENDLGDYVISGSDWRLLGEILPPEIKQKVDKHLWKWLYPNRTLATKIKDKFQK